MMIEKFVALALFALTLWLLSDAQAQSLCDELNLDNPLQSPVVGSNLPVCSTDDLQCCTLAYIDDVTQCARKHLIDGLREEFQNRIEDYERIVHQLLQYIAGDFSNAFRTHLPLTTLFTDDQLHSAVSGLIQNFVDNIVITRGVAYNISAFVQNITNDLADLAAESFAPGSMTQQTCITSFIQHRINQTVLRLIDRHLEQIKKGVTTAIRILKFLHNYNVTLGNFQPLQYCQQRLVELSFCSRCTRRIPPLCSNTCGALIQACYSPFVDGLKGEFDTLWSVTRQVFRATNNTLMQLFDEENPLIVFNPRTDVALLAHMCGTITVPSFRQDGNLYPRKLLPASIMDSLSQFSGVFEYDNDGPDICEPVSEFLTCNSSIGNQMCGRQEVKLCTAACNCWDGTTNRSSNTEQFIKSNIEGQVNNPVIQLNQQELMTQASALGTPVHTFLTNENFTEVSPDGVVVPPAEPYDGSGTVIMKSFSMMLIAALLATTINYD